MTAACRMKDEMEIKMEMDILTKCQDLKKEDCSLKPYMINLSLHEVREMFAIRTNMNKLRGNYSHDADNIKNKLKCVGCRVEGIKEVNSHMMKCDVYQDLWKTETWDNDRELVLYFRKVVE